MTALARRLTLAAALLAASGRAPAATFLVLANEATYAVGPRNVRIATPADGFNIYPQAGSWLSVVAISRTDNGARSVLFVPPAGEAFHPGSYSGLSQTGIGLPTPGFRLDNDDYGSCAPTDARLVVLDVAYAGDLMTRLAADFEQDCAGAPTIRGSFRWAAGDATCAGAADGTPCDDRDACSPASTCQAGECLPADPVSCGAPSGPCGDPPVCDPASGACLPATTRPNGSGCDDGNRCTLNERCTDGSCGGGFLDYCSDAGGCSIESCDPLLGCVSRPIPGVCGNPGEPTTYFFVESPPGEPLGGGRSRRIATAESEAYVFTLDAGAFEVRFFVPEPPYESWTIAFSPPAGGALAPGTYEDVAFGSGPSGGRAGLYVYNGGGGTCLDPTARFVVHELVRAADGTPASIVADVEVHCANAPASFIGAVRYHVGEAACAGQADGTPCDDANACTTASSCRQGFCVADASADCGAAAGCHTAPLCSPRTGACIAANALDDGTDCGDPQTCVEAGTCQAGVCRDPLRPACDDFDVCTADTCDGAGTCRHEPIAGSCWALRGSVTFVASALGHSCSCTQRDAPAPLALLDDHTFARPGGLAQCATETVLVPAETGTWKQKGRRLVLHTENLDDVLGALGRCAGQTTVVRGYRTAVRLARGGEKLRGVQSQRVRVPGTPVSLSVIERFRGRPTTHGRATDVEPLRDRCSHALATCLRDQILADQ